MWRICNPEAVLRGYNKAKGILSMLLFCGVFSVYMADIVISGFIKKGFSGKTSEVHHKVL